MNRKETVGVVLLVLCPIFGLLLGAVAVCEWQKNYTPPKPQKGHWVEERFGRYTDYRWVKDE